MLKRKRTEPVEKLRQRTAREEAAPIVAALVEALAAQPPAQEAEVSGRTAGPCRRCLGAAARDRRRAAGGVWPARARRAAIVLHTSREQDDSLGLRLLADVRVVFNARGVERISTADLIAALQADDEGPWASERTPLTPHRFARFLHAFGITSKQLRIGAASLKGYEREAFVDSWERYLPTPPSPVDPKQPNSEHERSFDVSDRTPSDGDGNIELVDLPIEEDYPRAPGTQTPARTTLRLAGLFPRIRPPDAGTTP